MTTIYLIRHAEAEGNLYRVIQGQQDALLTERGKLQVRALAERFRTVPVDAVYTSDLSRAAETAAGICRVQGLPLHRDAGLREICVGSWEGRPLGEIAREAPEQMEYFRKDLTRWHLEGAETVAQVTERMLSSLRRIAAAHEGGTAAVVSHGAAIRYVLGVIRGASLSEISRMSTGENTGVTVLAAENGEFRILSEDDASHLDEWMEKLEGRPYHKHKTGLQVGLWYRTPAPEERTEWLRAALDGGTELPACGAEDVLLGIRGEEAVGVAALSPELGAAQGEGWLGALWVRPEHRCCGYGAQLLGQAVQRYRRLGRETLCAAVEEDNGTALAFLRSHGFRQSNLLLADGRVLLRKEIAVRPPER